MDKRALEKQIEERYPTLPPILQQAARFAMDNPQDMALYSMRRVAALAGLQASAMHRLASQLGFSGYEAFRDVYRHWLAQGGDSFSNRASELQRRGRDDATQSLAKELLLADSQNLAELGSPETLEAIKAARATLADARRIYVLGLRSLFPAAFYFNYACAMFMDNTTLLTGIGGAFADGLRHAGAGDVLLVFSYHPYARETLNAVTFARQQGLRVVVVTDSVLSPVAPHAQALIVVGVATPSLFPSVVPALAVAQTLVALLIAQGGAESLKEIERSEAQLAQFSVYLQEGGSLSRRTAPPERDTP